MSRVALLLGLLHANAEAALQLMQRRGLRVHKGVWCQGTAGKFVCGEGSQCCGNVCVAPGGVCCSGSHADFPCGRGSECCGDTCQAPGGKCCANQIGTKYPVAAGTPCIHELKDCTSSNGTTLCPVVARRDDYPDLASHWAKIDAERSPPSGSLLLYGSSILREWSDAAQYWNHLPVLNRAFGGARTWEAALHFPDSVAKYRPRVLVVYCGSNDIVYHGSKRTSQERALSEIAGNIELILDASRQIQAQVLVLSVIDAPQKRRRANEARMVDGVNSALRALCEKTDHAEFLDLNPMLEDEEGRPLETIYRPDGLHFWPEAYKRFHAAMRDPVSRRWEMAKEQSQQVSQLSH